MKEKKAFNWISGTYIIGYHLFIAIALPLYLIFATGVPYGALISISAVLFIITGLSITGGYHRLFSHSTYRSNKYVEAIFVFFGSMACQGSVVRWAHDHRLHHAHIDSDKDPYSVTRGFWHAHILWMLEEQAPINEKIVSDLLRNPILRFQDKYEGQLMVLTNILCVTITGYLLNSFFGAFLFVWFIRQFVLHHSTWFINSLAHYVGHQNYSTEHTAVDNYLVSFLTFGEGYHNYHHTFAYDYRNGIHWYHFDPTKWLIWSLNKLGWATHLRSVNESRIKEQMIRVHKEALFEKLKHATTPRKSELEEKIISFTESLTKKMAQVNKLISEYKRKKKETGHIPTTLKKLSLEIQELKSNLKYEWKMWKNFSHTIMKLKEA